MHNNINEMGCKRIVIMFQTVVFIEYIHTWYNSLYNADSSILDYSGGNKLPLYI